MTAPRFLPLVLLGVLLGRGVGPASALQSVWSEPDLDWFAYVNAHGAGNRAFGPSFIGGLEIDETSGEFVPKGKEEPSRLAMPLFAFDTSATIAPGLSPARYQVHRVTVTATMASATFPGQSLIYDDTLDSYVEILADVQSNNVDAARPIELYGVGFRDDYAGFDFAGEGTADLFGENTPPYGSSDGGYIAYPIAAAEAGGKRDVSNSLTGGFSATEPTGETTPFDPSPLAIGTTDLPVGTPVPDDTTFSFELDLTESFARQYVQESLASGGIGFFASSLTLATQPGGDLLPYPQWYLKESAGGAVQGIPPTLTIDVDILPLPGDYDGNGQVDGADGRTWEAQYGATVPAGVDADGSSNGQVDGVDYLLWQRAYLPSSPAAAVVAPEPCSGLLLFIGLAEALAARRGDRTEQREQCRKGLIGCE